MATAAVTNDIQNGDALDADEVMENFDDLTTFLNNSVSHVDGSKAFTGIPTLPASDPTTANQAVRKSYADGLITAHNASGDHDGRYFTETEVNAALALKATVSSGKIIKDGSTSITFSAATTSSTASVTATGITTLSSVTASCERGVALAVVITGSNTFTIQGAWYTAISGTSTVYWQAMGV